MDINVETVQSVLGDGVFDVREIRGNVQVTFKDLAGITRRSGGRGKDDLKVVQGLAAAHQALTEAGYSADSVHVSLSHQNREKNGWVAFPCVWVNQPRAQEQEITKLRAEIADLTASFKAAVAAQAAGTTAPAPAPQEATEAEPENPL